jgi:hypothetical protein
MADASALIGGGGGVAPFTPSSITGLKLWVQSNMGITLGTGVSAWADQSGLGNNLAQATGAAQPTLNASDAAYNNAPTLSFNGSQYLTVADPLSSLPYTIYVVGESTSGSSNQVMVSTTSNSPNLYYEGGITAWTIYGGANLSSSNGTRTKQAYVGIYTGTSASALYINTSSSAAASGSAGSSTSSGTLYVGAQIGPQNELIGKIASVLLYNGTHTQSQISQVLTYLANAYAPGAWS